MHNELKNIFAAAGYDSTFTNRKRNVKTLNTLLATGLVTIILVRKGYIKRTTLNKEFNACVKIGTRMRVAHIKHEIQPGDILLLTATLLKDEIVKKELEAYRVEDGVCSKCTGTGFIPQFAWYAHGVCFDCMGTGFRHFELQIINDNKVHSHGNN